MTLHDLPPQAAWRHQGARDGFEVMFATTRPSGHTLAGHTTAVEAGVAWSVGYTIAVDHRWRSGIVQASSHTARGESNVSLERRDGDTWLVAGNHQPGLDGCVDVDFESSSGTNTLPIHRLELAVGEAVSVPAAFVRIDLRVERLEQTYTRLDDAGRFAYTSSTFDFECELTYDSSGLILEYPGIAVRAS